MMQMYICGGMNACSRDGREILTSMRWELWVIHLEFDHCCPGTRYHNFRPHLTCEVACLEGTDFGKRAAVAEVCRHPTVVAAVVRVEVTAFETARVLGQQGSLRFGEW